MKTLDDFLDNEEIKVPETLKEMLVSEIDIIRESMIIVNMFLGEPMKTGLKYLQEFEPKQIITNE